MSTRPCAWQRCRGSSRKSRGWRKLDELRWILLGLGILAIGAIWLWTARGSRQAPGNSVLREPTVSPVHTASSAPSELPSERRDATADKREWGISPLEPLSIRTADFSDVPALDQPMLTHADPVDFSLDSSRATGAPRFEPPPASPTVDAEARPEPVRPRRARVEPARSEPAVEPSRQCRWPLRRSPLRQSPLRRSHPRREPSRRPHDRIPRTAIGTPLWRRRPTTARGRRS